MAIYGLLAALTAGLLFGLNGALVRAAGRSSSTLPIVVSSLEIGTPLLWISAAVSGQTGLSLKGCAAYLAAGVLSFAVGRGMFYYAIGMVGATTASVITAPTAVLSALLAWLLLGEPLPPRLAAAVLLVALAVYLAGSRPSGQPQQARHRAGLLGVASALSSALVFAFSTILVRYGGSRYGSPIGGAAISYTAASAIVLPYAWSRGSINPFKNQSRYLLAAAAIAVTSAQMLRYLALSLISVAEAVILISLFPMHTALFSMAIKGLDEKPGPRHLAAALASLLAVYLAAG